MRRQTTALVVAVIVSSLSGCDGGTNEATSPTSEELDAASTPPASDVEQVCQRFLPIYMSFATTGTDAWSLDAVYGALYVLNSTYPASGLRAMSPTVQGTLTEADVSGMATECEERSSVDYPHP